MNLSYKFTEAQPDALFVPPLSYPVNLSTIQDLPLTASGVDVHLSVGEVARLLERHPDWPGVILTAQGRFVGLLTRRACSEFLGNMLGTRIFSEVSIFAFFKKYGAGGLILDGGVSVEGAVRAARDDRQGDAVHDPIVVCQGQCQYGLLDMPVLLKAQAIL